MRSCDIEFIRLAEFMAQKSQMHYKLAAVIVHRKRVISVGYNRYLGLNSNVGMSDKWSIHAEADSLRRAINYVHNHPTAKLTIYIARRGNKNAKPCINCLKLLMPYINRFVYTQAGEVTEDFAVTEV